MIDLITVKENTNKLLVELAKKLEGIDQSEIDLNKLDRPILESGCSRFECQESEARPLTQDEKDHYREKLGCSGNLLENATIHENGKIYIKTINEHKEGQKGEDGVTYNRKTVEVNGVKVDGVFPKFDSTIDVQLPEHLIHAKDKEQKNFGNEALKDKIKNDPEFAQKFSDEQLEQINSGETPDGYTWHHNEEYGKLQLVNSEDHQNNRHTGGKAIWGGGKESR